MFLTMANSEVLKCCYNCRFFYQLESDELGECRKKPPVVAGIDEKNRIITAFPNVEKYEFCGKFKKQKRRHKVLNA